MYILICMVKQVLRGISRKLIFCQELFHQRIGLHFSRRSAFKILRIASKAFGCFSIPIKPFPKILQTDIIWQGLIQRIIRKQNSANLLRQCIRTRLIFCVALQHRLFLSCKFSIIPNLTTQFTNPLPQVIRQNNRIICM